MRNCGDDESRRLVPQLENDDVARAGDNALIRPVNTTRSRKTREALELCDRAYVLSTGRVVLSGAGKELLRNEQVNQAYLGG